MTLRALRRRVADGPPAAPAPPPTGRRLLALLGPGRRALAGMLALTAVGAGLGVLPAMLAGRLLTALVHPRGGGSALGWAVAIAAATVGSSLAYALSDGARAWAGAGLFARLRLEMLAGVARLGRAGVRLGPGVVSRFVSDAELLEQATIGALDGAAVAAFELLWALGALLVLDPLSALATVVLVAVGAPAVRLAQRPLERAGTERQERLEALTGAVGATLGDADRGDAVAAVEATRRADGRLGAVEAANRHLSGALSGLAPIAVTVLAGWRGGFGVGALLSILLVSERALQAVDAVADVAVDVRSVRGAVARCLALADA